MADQPLSSIQLEFHGNILGKNTFTLLWYEAYTLYTDAASALACAAGYSQIWGVLKPLLSEQFTLTTIQAVVYQIPSSQSRPRHIMAVGETGETEDDALPPYATVRMLKIPDNEERWPENSTAFQGGRTGWPGLGEDSQADGLLTPTALGDFATAFEAMETLTVSYGSSAVYHLAMIRPRLATGQDWVAHVPVLDTIPSQILGTQNSRKY